ncbi:MAG: hypothetical protein K2N87_12950 [Eubacterium sp.]|nr:hypothetical protein [Eubacterium sp.]
MFSFLYVFAPGIISWLVCRYFSKETEKGSLFLQACEILAYAAIVLALTAAFLEPQGAVTVEVLENGMFTVRYGTKALVLSVALAAGLGVCSAIGVGSIARYKGKFLTAGIAAAAAFGILVYTTGAPAPDGMLTVSTKPVRVNNVFYESEVPIYVDDQQEYFIQARELSNKLGIQYEEKRTGLFRTEYSLGGQAFTLNVLKTDNGYWKKDGELFISLSNLNQIEGIQVRNSQALYDGSSREVIYIDNYVQRFDYEWTNEPYIAHALGGVDGNSYTNSREAFLENYRAGHRVFEVDLRLTKDGNLVAVHDLPENEHGEPMTLKEFKKYKVQGKYTSMTFRGLALLMKKYPDIYVVTDSKETEADLVAQQFSQIVETGSQVEPEILNRIIPQIYNMEMYDTIMNIYPWNSMIFTLYALGDFSEREVVDFAYQRGIGVITTHIGKNQSMFFHELYERDIKVYMHTFNTPEEEANLKRGGVWGIYTDFLKP